MRWRSKWDYIAIGDTRLISKFLIFPKRINRESRWLEKATYRQECEDVLNYGSMDYGTHKEWVNKEWVK